MKTEFYDVWWSMMSGPSSVVDAVSSALLGGKLVLLTVPGALPWEWQMRDSIQSILSNYDLIIDYVSCEEEDVGSLIEPSEFLLKHYDNSDILNGYRSYSGVSLPEYLALSNVLCGKVVWFKDMSSEHFARWLSFCRQYKPQTLNGGLFVMECNNSVVFNQLPQHIEAINYDKAVSKYDLQLFCSLVVSNMKLNINWKQYISTLAASLFLSDAEAAADFIVNVDFQTEDVLETLERLAMKKSDINIHYQNNNDGNDLLDSQSHPFYLIGKGNAHELKLRIWEAQNQVVFPLIQKLFTEIITKYYCQIQESMTVLENDNYFNGEMENPYDIDMSILLYLINSIDASGKRILHIPRDDYECLMFLSKRRNDIAHIRCCSPQDLDTLFNIGMTS
jgi:hypothetical protein